MLEDPEKVMLSGDELPLELPKPKVLAEDDEWGKICRVLYERGLVRPVETCASLDGVPIENGAFGVVKAGKTLESGEPILRLIMDFRGCNAVTRIIEGDVKTLAGAPSLQHLVLPEGTVLRISAEDLVAAFYLFAIPPRLRCRSFPSPSEGSATIRFMKFPRPVPLLTICSIKWHPNWDMVRPSSSFDFNHFLKSSITSWASSWLTSEAELFDWRMGGWTSTMCSPLLVLGSFGRISLLVLLPPERPPAFPFLLRLDLLLDRSSVPWCLLFLLLRLSPLTSSSLFPHHGGLRGMIFTVSLKLVLPVLLGLPLWLVLDGVTEALIGLGLPPPPSYLFGFPLVMDCLSFCCLSSDFPAISFSATLTGKPSVAISALGAELLANSGPASPSPGLWAAAWAGRPSWPVTRSATGPVLLRSSWLLAGSWLQRWRHEPRTSWSGLCRPWLFFDAMGLLPRLLRSCRRDTFPSPLNRSSWAFPGTVLTAGEDRPLPG